MKAEIFTICDSAKDADGKLFIHGAYDTVLAPGTPAQSGHLAIVARVRFQRSEEGIHKITIFVIDTDGKIMGKFIGDDIPVGLPPKPNALRADFIVNVNGFMLPKFGEYRVDLVIDGNQVAQIPLYFHQAS